jgi:hypothetical protein
MSRRQLRLVLIIGICVSLLATGRLLPSVVAATPTFSDVDPHSTSPYATAIYALAQRGILNGYNDSSGRFGPLDPILRAQVAAVVVRALGWTGNQGHTNFSDQGTVDNELWNSVRVLADRSVARGFGDGTYRPTAPVAQVQVISLITRAMVNAGDWQNQPAASTLYPDVPASSGARTDLATYTFYAGTVPFATSAAAGGWTNWSQPANRQEVALVTWNALQSRGHKTPTPTPTSAPQPPTPTTSPAPAGTIVYAAGAPWATQPPQTGSPAPVAGQQCPAWVHDRYAVQGQDGRWYPTWHPPVDPQYGCWFGHEHGADPRTARANSALPPFGYAAAHMGMIEPHEGFKVAVINAGDTQDGSTAHADYRVVLHMGTSGIGRYTQQFHSVQYDYVAEDGSGRSFHIFVMGDTGNGTGSTCTTPRDGGKDFSTVGCNDPYEIWNSVSVGIIDPSDPYAGPLQQRLYATFSLAVFDPITTRDPANPTRVLRSADYYGTGSFQGCKREMYGGPNYFANANHPTSYWTDAHGHVVPAGTPGAIQQFVAAVRNGQNDLFKLRRDTCDPTLHGPN